MAQPSVTLLVNISESDQECTNPAGDAAFQVVDSGDLIVWRSADREDGDEWSDPVKYPVVRPTTGSKEAEKTFLVDAGEDEYVQIPLAGSSEGSQLGGATQYVFAAYVGGETEGIPTLEAWNSDAHEEADSDWLGGGTPANSLLRAVATTNDAPGSADWAGTPLSGEDSSVELDTAILSAAKYLYWNMRLLVPSTFPASQSSDHVLAIRILYS